MWIGDEEFVANVLTNTVSRSWTVIGVPESYERAEVDPRGLVVSGPWSMDWWVRAGDQWVFPSRAPAVRQRLADNMPVVETVLRVGGGDVVHRAAAARSASSDQGASEALLIEITNETGAPIAVATAARPYELSAYSQVHGGSMEWDNGGVIEGITVDGRSWSLRTGWHRQVIFDRLPGDVIAASGGVDCAASLVAASQADVQHSTPVAIRPSGPADDGGMDTTVEPDAAAPVSVESPDRLATAAAVFPLVAGSTLRVAIIARNWGDWSDTPAIGPKAADLFDRLPSLERVAHGWRRRLDAGCRLELPGGRFADAVEAARASLLLSTWPADDGHGTTGPMLWHPAFIVDQEDGDDLVQLLGLIEGGSPELARDLLIRQAQVQDASGYTTSLGRTVTATSLVLAEHLLSLHGDQELAEALGEFVTSAVRWLLTRDAEWEQAWANREGLRAGYRMLRRLGADRAATELRRAGKSLPPHRRLDVSAEPDAPTFYLNFRGHLPWEIPEHGQNEASTKRRWEWEMRDGGLWVHAAVPWSPALPFVSGEPPEGTPTDFVPDAEASRGHDLMATALLAFAEARVAPARAYERLEALVSVASPTLNWPTFMHPQLRTGTDGAGQDLRVGGLIVRTLLRLLVDAPDDGGSNSKERPKLRIAAHWPAAWLGQPVEVHDVPTRIGTVSWAVRWHGERPALLWDVVPRDSGGEAPSVTAPGLDPAFTATQWRGETLLAPMPAP